MFVTPLAHCTSSKRVWHVTPACRLRQTCITIPEGFGDRNAEKLRQFEACVTCDTCVPPTSDVHYNSRGFGDKNAVKLRQFKACVTPACRLRQTCITIPEVVIWGPKRGCFWNVNWVLVPQLATIKLRTQMLIAPELDCSQLGDQCLILRGVDPTFHC